MCTREPRVEHKGKARFCFDCAKRSHYFDKSRVSWRPLKNFTMFHRKKSGRFGKNDNVKYLAPKKKNAAVVGPSGMPEKTQIEGRRVVEVGEVIRQLREGCKRCGNKELNLTDTMSESIIGLASIFSVKCTSCEFVNSIHSSKMHEVETKKVYDVNSKAALGE